METRRSSCMVHVRACTAAKRMQQGLQFPVPPPLPRSCILLCVHLSPAPAYVLLCPGEAPAGAASAGLWGYAAMHGPVLHSVLHSISEWWCAWRLCVADLAEEACGHRLGTSGKHMEGGTGGGHRWWSHHEGSSTTNAMMGTACESTWRVAQVVVTGGGHTTREVAPRMP